MIRISLVLIVFIVLACAKPPAKTEMNFERIQKTSFEEIQQIARKQDKPVFVDVYTVWCGPCKYMDEKVFTSLLVAEKFNKDLVAFKVNAEDADGVKFAARYKVNAYPTFLFLSPDGEVLLRLDGVFTPEMLVEEADFALKEYKKGK